MLLWALIFYVDFENEVVIMNGEYRILEAVGRTRQCSKAQNSIDHVSHHPYDISTAHLLPLFPSFLDFWT